MIVSGSSAPPPASAAPRIASTYSCGWIAVTAAASASGASRRSSPSQPRDSSSFSIAGMRALFSGCGPVSCSRELAWWK